MDINRPDPSPIFEVAGENKDAEIGQIGCMGRIRLETKLLVSHGSSLLIRDFLDNNTPKDNKEIAWKVRSTMSKHGQASGRSCRSFSRISKRRAS